MPRRTDREQLEHELEGLKVSLEEWRKKSPMGRRRIPVALWAEAARAAVRFGVSAVSILLKLDYSKLKSESLEYQAASEQALEPMTSAGPTQVAPTFVELFGSQTSTPRTLTPCVLQVESHRGSRLRVEVSGLDASGLALVLREFT